MGDLTSLFPKSEAAWCSCVVLLLALAWQEPVAPVLGLRTVSGPGELQVCLPGNILGWGGSRMVRS